MQTQKPLSIIIFGITGELYKQKLGLALWHLFDLDLLPAHFKIIGFGRQVLTNSDLQKLTGDIIKKKEKKHNTEKLKKFLSHVEYVEGNIDDRASFKKLGERIDGNAMFYLAVPPSLAGTIAMHIAKAGLNKNKKNIWKRIVVEKPFGSSLAEAKKLNAILKKFFNDEQIFRVDHYLAKETMLHILPFRAGNPALESVWNNFYIQSIRVVFFEENKPEDKIEKRGNFYDKLGALRDVGQNHVLQMLATVTGELPTHMTAEHIQNVRAQLLGKLLLHNASLTRGQYEGYLEEPGVQPHSKTETFFRIALEIKDKKWKGVPVTLESGKALHHEEMSVEIFFKHTPARIKFVVSDTKTGTFKQTDCFIQIEI